MEDPSLPKPDPPQPSIGKVLGRLVGANLAALVLLGIVGGFVAMLSLPILNIVVGVVLLLLGEKRLGLILVLSGLLVSLVGLGTCALILSNVSFRH